MKIISCNIFNFGVLHNFKYDFKEPVDKVIRENGFGKSTLAAFIRIMLFGFEGENKRDALRRERKLYEPWQGGNYGGELFFEIGQKSYCLTRIFKEKQDYDTFELRDLSTNLVSSDYSRHIGQELFGMDSDTFKRTVFIGQDEVYLEPGDSLAARISALVDSTADINSFEKALALLEKEASRVSEDKKNSEINGVSDRISLLSGQLENEALLMESLDTYRHQNEELKDRMDTLNSRKDKLREEARTQSFSAHTSGDDSLICLTNSEQQNYNELVSLYGNDFQKDRLIHLYNEVMFRSNLTNDVNTYRNKVTEAQGRIDSALRKKKHKVALYFIFGCVLAILAFPVFMMLESIHAGIITSIAFLIMGICAAIYAHHDEIDGKLYDELKFYEEHCSSAIEDIEDIDTELMGFLTEYHKVDERGYNILTLTTSLQEIQNEVELLEDYKKRIQQSSQLNMVRKASLELDKVLEELQECNNAVLQNNRGIAEIEQRLDDLHRTKDDLRELKDRKQEMAHKYDCLKVATMHLATAKETLTSGFTQPILDRFRYYYSVVMNDNNREYLLDRDVRLSVKEGGLQHSVETLSRGLKDVVGLSLRMALIDVMFPKEKPVIIMDDPFVNLDRLNLDGASGLIREVSNSYQIIFFTARDENTPV